MITNQAYLFLIFTLDGVGIALLFDFFRILRRSFKTADFVTYIEDVLFWLIAGMVVLYSAFIFNNGEIRAFMIFGIIIGALLYILLLSNYVMKFSILIIGIIKKIVGKTYKILSYPIIQIFKFIKQILPNFNKVKNSKIAKFFEKKEGILK
jgi:spore cortex biosynthesis protein YabQ